MRIFQSQENRSQPVTSSQGINSNVSLSQVNDVGERIRPWWIIHVGIVVVTLIALFASFIEFHRRRKRLHEAKLHRLSKNRKFVTIWCAQLRVLLAKEAPPSPVLLRHPLPTATYRVEQRSSAILVVRVELRRRAANVHQHFRSSIQRLRNRLSAAVMSNERSTDRSKGTAMEMTPFCSAAATSDPLSSADMSEDVFLS